MSGVQRLGKNQGGYFGERIEIEQVLRDGLEAARKFGWRVETLPTGSGLDLLTVHRSEVTTTRKIYISTGIHGDEPAGPLAIRQLLHENSWPADAAIWLCPCLNPTGFPLNRRENAKGIDLNRDYRHLVTDEIRAHVAWLNRQPSFDLTLCVHEDWEANGFYLYELNLDHEPSHGERIIREVGEVCPIDHSSLIEGRPAQIGIIRPDLDPTKRPQWPEAFFLIRNKTRHSYTLEAPSDFPLPTRVAALVTAVRTAIQAQ
ncbi:MAG: M14 family metallocarboxypeptidase [Verrucomicrobia bacterium]|nr:M14 family metallocarboxypeptidase [Verrucomicrobiota bacterium]